MTLRVTSPRFGTGNGRLSLWSRLAQSSSSISARSDGGGAGLETCSLLIVTTTPSDANPQTSGRPNLMAFGVQHRVLRLHRAKTPAIRRIIPWTGQWAAWVFT